MRRLFDEIDEVFGKRLRIRRAKTNAPVFASLKERFALFPGTPENWSQILWEPDKISMWSAPSGVQCQTIPFNKTHRVRFSFGAEFGGPLVISLYIFGQERKLAELSLRLKNLISREQGKDFALRCAHLAGLSSYQVLQEDHELLLLEFSLEVQSAPQNAYRESTALPLVLPAPAQPSSPAPPNLPRNSSPSRAPDDSYLVVSWNPNAVLHFYASQATNWEEPQKSWEKDLLRESFFDMTRRSLALWQGKQYRELPFVTFQKLWLRRQYLQGAHQVSLDLLHENGAITLAESSNQSARSAYEALSHLATSLSEALHIECLTDLAPSSSAVKLLAISAKSELIFAGTDGERAIAWAKDASQTYKLFTAKKGAFVSISSQPNTWMICDSGDIYGRNANNSPWREIRPLGRRPLRAICQDTDGVALAVGEKGAIFRRTNDGEWAGIPLSVMPFELQQEDLTSACYSNDVFYIGSKRGRLYQSSNGGGSWDEVSSFNHPISALSTSDDGCLWGACENGDVFYSKSGVSFSKIYTPAPKRLNAIAGTHRSAYAVGERGILWALQARAHSSSLPIGINFYLACAKISKDSPPPEENGLLSEINVTWHRVLELPETNWLGASWENGSLYLVGEAGLLLRIGAN